MLKQTLLIGSFALCLFSFGCETPPRSTPIMYGDSGNRGVTAPSKGVPQNIGEPLGGTVTSSPGETRPDQTIVGPSAGPDASGSGTIGTGGDSTPPPRR